MSEHFGIAKLQTTLEAFGINVYDDDSPWHAEGFPLVLELKGGRRAVLDLPDPGVFSNLNPEQVGIAILGQNGRLKKSWGLANKIAILKKPQDVLQSDLFNLIQDAISEGNGSILMGGYRYFAAAASKRSRTSDVLLVITDASEERRAQATAAVSTRSAVVFQRIGKALTMHQTMNELAVLVAHEIASAAGLAAVLLWCRSTEEEAPSLRAHVGVSRQGASLIQTLEPNNKLTCAAELVAGRKQLFWVPDVEENMITQQLEAKFCYLQPRSMCAIPLVVGDNVIGILELVGRDGDDSFEQSRDLFESIGEHLALALNTCIMFESVERLASFDPMTGVANHRALQDFLHNRVAEAERTHTDIGVVMLDVDHFRSFNEEEGHDAGDMVLKKVAQAIKDTIRPYDLAARYGGEEFSIIMPGLDLDFTAEVAERIRRRIQEIEFVSANGRARIVTASMGVANFPNTAKDPASLLKAADLALFKAKRNGRNQVIKYEGPLRNDQQQVEVDLEWMKAFVNEKDEGAAEVLGLIVRPFRQYIDEKLMLSKTQSSILEQLIKIYPAYKRLMAEDAEGAMKKFEAEGEFRPLLPSLLALPERFDGSGPLQMSGDKIPLLARVMNVLLSIAEENGRSLISDPGRFDPEIVAMIADVQEAA